jgi:hypothetical protein
LVCAFAGESACTNFGGGSGMWSQGLGACCSAGDGGCPDLTTDPHNCGGCGVVCASGVCTPDPSHTTGQCFPATAGTGCSGQSGCSNGLACVDGYCVAPRCVSGPMPPGSLLCAATGDQLGYCCDAHGHPQNNFCANLQTDPAHCGGCDSACMSGQSCVQGRCS